MKLPWWSLLVAVVFGAAASYGIMHWRDNAKIVALQQHADSIAVQAAQATAQADSEHAAVAAIVAQRDSVERSAKVLAAIADKRVAAFHDALHATVAHDSAASAQLDSMTNAFAADTIARNNAIVAADARVGLLTNENGQLLATVHALNGQIQGLNAQIQSLNHKTLPPWLNTGLWVVDKALALKGATDVVRGR